MIEEKDYIGEKLTTTVVVSGYKFSLAKLFSFGTSVFDVVQEMFISFSISQFYSGVGVQVTLFSVSIAKFYYIKAIQIQAKLFSFGTYGSIGVQATLFSVSISQFYCGVVVQVTLFSVSISQFYSGQAIQSQAKLFLFSCCAGNAIVVSIPQFILAR